MSVHSDSGPISLERPRITDVGQRLNGPAQDLMYSALRLALSRGKNYIEPQDIEAAIGQTMEQKALHYMANGLKVRLPDGHTGPIIEIYHSCVTPRKLRAAVNDGGRLQHADIIPGHMEFC